MKLPTELMTTMEKLSSFLNTPVISVGETSISLYNIMLFLLIGLATLIISRIMRRSFKRFSEHTKDADPSSLYILERFLNYGLIAIGLAIGLAALGIDMTHLALLATALSVGVGFGLQSIFNNFFSGIIILLEKSLKVGDFIELDDQICGIVISINIRSTMIRTLDNLDILVPNSDFVSGRVINWTLHDPNRRVRIPFGVAYGSDKELVKKAGLEAAEKVDMTLNLPGKEPDVWLVNFGDSSLDFELVVWIDPRKNKKPGGIFACYLWEIETKLREHKIEIPFPQRDLHIRSGLHQKQPPTNSGGNA